MKNIYLKITLVLSLFVFMTSCDDDEFTGDSTLNASSPSLAVSLSFENNVTLVETDASYSFTVTLSEPQIVNVSVNLSQIGGDATQGEDFDFPHNIVIPKGQLSASGDIVIMKDDIIEDTETAIIQIATGSEANVSSISSKTITFNIQNLEEGDLIVGLSWDSTNLVTDNSGNEIDAYDLADLRLLLTDSPYTTILDGADGAGAETYVLSADSPDGEYFIVADFYAAMDIPADLDLTISFDQVGVINGEGFNYVAALNTSESCSAAHFVMAKITKTGNSYEYTSVGTPAALDLNNFVGTWEGTTSYGYDTQMVTTIVGGQLYITGVGVGFMENDWGEVITDMQALPLIVDPVTGAFTIVEAPYMTTTYLGDPQPVYNLVATGMLSGTCTPTIDLDYDFIQAGTSYTEWLTVGNGWPPFEEHNTL